MAAWRPAGVDALCPFGGIETLWTFISDGMLVQKIALSSLILLGASIAVALFMGRAFCGQVCPLGTLQELSGRLGRRIFGRQLTVPPAIDVPARWLKYAILGVLTIASWVTASLIIRPYDPWAAYHHLTSPELFLEFGVGATVLGVTIIGSFAYDRFFCKYACPMGAALGLLSRFSLFKVRRDAETCTDCTLCSRACPVNIDVMARDVIDSAECIGCGECVSACPSSGTGTLMIATGAGRSISPLQLTLITLGIFLGIVAVATAADQFAWSMPTIRSEVEHSSETGESFDGSVIKGHMSMNDVASQTGISASQLQADFGLEPGDLDVPLKDLKEARGFTMEDVRSYVGAALAD